MLYIFIYVYKYYKIYLYIRYFIEVSFLHINESTLTLLYKYFYSLYSHDNSKNYTL